MGFEIVKRVFQNPFFKNVIKLMTGTSISQIILIAVSPILTRMYSPEEFGVFALFSSISSILIVCSSGRYEYAILKSKSENEANLILNACIKLVTIFSFFVLAICILFSQYIIGFFNNNLLEKYIFLIPFFTFLGGINQIFNIYLTYSKKYKEISINKVFQSTSNVLYNLSGLISNTIKTTGLVGGAFFGMLISNLLFLFKLKPVIKYNNQKNRVKSILFKYIDYPKYSIAGAIANDVGFQMPNFIISKLYSSIDLGFFSFSNRIINTPLNFVSGAYTQVLIEEMSKLNFDNKKIIKKYLFSKILVLTLITLPLFLIIFFFGPELFSFVFGENWRIAGEISKYLIFSVIIRFIVSPFGTIFLVNNKVYVGSYWQILYLIGISFMLFFSSNLPILEFAKIFSIVNGVLYAFLLVLVFKYV